MQKKKDYNTKTSYQNRQGKIMCFKGLAYSAYFKINVPFTRKTEIICIYLKSTIIALSMRKSNALFR